MRITKRYIFDLDNTLVYTDLLNNDSYNYALKKLGFATISDCKRITRDVILSRYPELNNFQKNKIIELKQKYFLNNLKNTSPNTSVIQVLEDQNVELCILWTSADETRVFAILEHYKIYNRFKKVLFSSKLEVVKDIEKICEILECGFEHLIFYEDNQRVIQDLHQLNLNVISV
ncbi:HAD family hydrolase [Fusibacter tunisiensis]|uniref:Phosphoglycolate phosphatase-like HAD superfamily hydrolase n=1 Tax=Fusibacter tunisiensis TaxID=1008308 RepID=A0ABS2MN83_9FIRM|nr:HAD hydrolase-like protein [Fusibacter tunisiensis]MBM7560857.1 phosphoglycolate phosphatase-like HAD superfamily hydrolase [Fusibacter tunisiensis]